MKKKKDKIFIINSFYDMQKIIIPVIAIFLSLTIGAIIIKAIGADPLLAYKILFKGAFGSINSIGEILVKATPLILTGLSFAFAIRAGLFNIGAEGQLYMGGFFATLVGISFKGLPMIIHLPLVIIAAFIGGGLWGFFAGWLKVKFEANEIITTVMLNYVAIFWVSYLVTGPMKAHPGTFPQSESVATSAQLPRILPPTRVHLGLIIALICIVLYYIFFRKMILGYETRITGKNMDASKYAGMNSERIMLFIMFISGGMAGLAGASEILGIQGRLLADFSPGYGFSGIVVSLVGMNSPFGIFLTAILFGILKSGGNLMQMIAKVPVAVIYIIEGLVVIFVLAGQGIRLKIKYLINLKRYGQE